MGLGTRTRVREKKTTHLHAMLRARLRTRGGSLTIGGDKLLLYCEAYVWFAPLFSHFGGGAGSGGKGTVTVTPHELVFVVFFPGVDCLLLVRFVRGCRASGSGRSLSAAFVFFAAFVWCVPLLLLLVVERYGCGKLKDLLSDDVLHALDDVKSTSLFLGVFGAGAVDDLSGWSDRRVGSW